MHAEPVDNRPQGAAAGPYQLFTQDKGLRLLSQKKSGRVLGEADSQMCGYMSSESIRHMSDHSEPHLALS